MNNIENSNNSEKEVLKLKSKIIVLLVLSLLMLTTTMTVLAQEKPEDKFYSSLTNNKHIYKEYQNATLNIREKINEKDLHELDLKLGKYSFGDLSNEYKDKEVYFFASVYEDQLMVVKKYVIYDLQGNLLNLGFGRKAKKEAVLNGEFNGWSNLLGKEELSDTDPTN